MNYKEIQIRILVRIIKEFEMYHYRYDVVYEKNCIIVMNITRGWTLKIADCNNNQSNVIVMVNNHYIGTASDNDSELTRCAIHTMHKIYDVLDTYKGVYPNGATLEQLMEGANR